MSRDYDGELVSLKVQNSSGLVGMYTPEHPIRRLTGDQVKRIKGYRYGQGYSNNSLLVEPEWACASTITVGDYVQLPVPPTSHVSITMDILKDLQSINSNYSEYSDGRIRVRSGRGGGIPRFITLDEEFAWFLGMYFAEGSYCSSNITFALHKKEQAYSDRIEAVAHRLGIRSQVRINNNTRTVTLSSFVFGTWLKAQFFHTARHKTIPLFIYKQSSDFIKAFIRGVFNGDGHIRESGALLEIASETGALNIIILLESIGVYPYHLVSHKNGRPYHIIGFRKKYCYNIFGGDAPKSGNTVVLEYNGNIYMKVKEVKLSHYTGKVYNLGVEQDHSYTSNFVAVHNCLTGLEMQASGVPMITSNLGALPETLCASGNNFAGSDPRNKLYIHNFVQYTKEMWYNIDIYRNACLEYIKSARVDWFDVCNEWEKLLWGM
jgi:hypothetical protein